ncbi:MAG TPA: ATP-binding protein [Candidatus Acidoferrum sp.]|nr:ATP-binding protein [Candidatus Acidoferrum sp.]
MKTLQPGRRGQVKERNGELNRGLLLRLELPSDPGLLCAVRGAVERLTESFGFSAEECRAVTRAVDEALTNIIRHAYSGRPDRPIEMFFRAIQGQAAQNAAGGLEILLCDRGPAIKPDQMCMRALEEVKPGGLGLHFIQQSMDIVEYKRANGTNRLRLVKYVHAPKQGVKS